MILSYNACPFFLFNCEYALAQHGGAYIMFSNGMPAVVKNPKNREILCKHLVRLISRIEEKKI